MPPVAERHPLSPVLLLTVHLFPFSQSGLPYVEVLCKNRYVGRTFIQPNMRLRQLGVAKKFGVLTDNFKGKRVVLVDDSIVRGNTISPIIRLLKESGAKEVSNVETGLVAPKSTKPCWHQSVRYPMNSCGI